MAEPAPLADEPLEVALTTPTELRTSIQAGAFASAGHVAAVGLALIHGVLALPSAP